MARGFIDPYRVMDEGDHDAEKQTRQKESNAVLYCCLASAVAMTIYCVATASYVPWLRGAARGSGSDYAPTLYPKAELLKVYYVNAAGDVERRRSMEAMLGGSPGGASRGHERVGALEATTAADLAPPSEIGAFIASHRSCDAYECAATPNPAACCVDRASAEGRSADSVYNALADDAFACVPDPALAFASAASHAGCYARVAAWASFVKACVEINRWFGTSQPNFEIL